jgi:large repetitive protein
LTARKRNLWYVLAEENGLTDPDALIQEGTVIQVPNEVLSVSNSSNSFKPFNIADAIGDTSPTQPAPPRPKKKGCGVLGQILIVVVAIVVTWFTAGALAEAGWGAVGAAMGGAAAGSAVSQGEPAR